RFDNAPAKKKPALRQPLFQRIKRCEQRTAGLFVGALTRCETRPVNAVVHIVVNESSEPRMVRLDVLWKQIHSTLAEATDRVVKQPADVILRVIYDPAAFLVHSTGTVTRP